MPLELPGIFVICAMDIHSHTFDRLRRFLSGALENGACWPWLRQYFC
jgi:hypothetical protein